MMNKIKKYSVDDLQKWGYKLVALLEKSQEENRKLKMLLIANNIPFGSTVLKGSIDEKDNK